MDEFEALLSTFEEPADESASKEETLKPVILVVDDDPSIRRALSRAFADRYDVLTAERGSQGVEVLSEAVHCVILGVKMKEENGFTAYPKLKAKSPDVPIIFYTAFQSEHDLQGVINKCKPEGYVDKGQDIAFLTNLIGNAVSKYRLVLENKEYKEGLEEKVVEINEANRLLKEQREHEKRLERAMTGGFAHEMRNALTGATLEISSFFQNGGDASAEQELREKVTNILEFILSMENQFGIPEDTIDQRVIPHISKMNETMLLACSD